MVKLQMGLLDLNAKKSISKILEFSVLRGGKNAEFRNTSIFEHTSAPNYITMTKLHMGGLALNTKKPFSSILEFSILRGGG